MKYRAEYSRIVEDWRKSGLNRADYSAVHGYHPNTFDGWIKKMSRPVGQSKSPNGKVSGSSKIKSNKVNQTKSSVLVPLKFENVPQSAISPTFELRYPNGVSLSMSSLPTTEDFSRIVHLYRSELCLR
jgi:hypothetical protein